MKKKLLSVLLCLCMVASLIPCIVLTASAAEYIDYNITSTDAADVATALDGVADVSEDGGKISITLTSDINGCLHIGEDNSDDWTGTIILDLNGHTIDPGNLNEGICLDNNYYGTLTLIGNGTIKTGVNNIVYVWGGDLAVDKSAGYDYFTAKVDGSNLFTYDKLYSRETKGSRIHGDELVITQGIGLPATYTVTFDANGYGTAPAAITDVIEDRRISRPSNPTADGYVFKGWYKEATCENAWDFYSDTVTSDITLYARWVDASTPPDGYTSDANRIMSYELSYGAFDIKGFFGGEWKDTSFDDSYVTYLKIGDDTNQVSPVALAENGYDVLNMNIAMDFNFMNDGKTLQLVYTVKNNSDTEKTFSLGSGTDIQIGIDDSALITEFEDGSGFKMVSDSDSDKNSEGEFAQFNFFGKDYVGVTDVTSFWYGAYSSGYSSNGHYWSGRNDEAIFFDNEYSESGDFDSAATWHWTDTLDPGATGTYSILIGIGGADSENSAESTNPNPSTPGSTPTPPPTPTPHPTYTVTFDANGGTVSPTDAVTEEDGKLTVLPTPTREGRYTFKGWFTEAQGGDEVTTDTVFTDDTTIYAKWIYRSGALSAGSVPSKDPKPEADKQEETPVVPTPPAEDTFFEDVKSEDWFHDDIKYVFESGLMNGISTEFFAPNAKLTRAMLVTVLYRLEGEPATNRSIPFADIDMGAYYANAVSWAQQNGIVKGISETAFSPDTYITREQLAAIMHRYAQYKTYDVSVGENTNILSYTDAEAVSEYAIASMQYACGSGLINGKSASTLAPKDGATRAEVAAIIRRFIEGNK